MKTSLTYCVNKMHSFLLTLTDAERGTHRSFRLVTGWSPSAVGVIIECGVLHESRKNKQETDSDEKIHCCDIRDSG